MPDKKKSLPKWIEFDEQWYRSRYVAIIPMIEDVYGGDIYNFYQNRGCKIGHSPNMYFDEKWYLLTYPNVAQLVKEGDFKSGFDHYCQEGYKNNSPHWLFSEKLYCDRYAERNERFASYKNGYDHYLYEGDYYLYSGSPFFNPNLYLSQQNNFEEALEEGAFHSYLKELLQGKAPLWVSWYFDEKWYLETYPQVKSLIKQRLYLNGLHHYLANDTPTAFSPLAGFSEEFYNTSYTDVASAVNANSDFLNGYYHFILHGYKEGRQPNSQFDIGAYALQDEVKKAIESGLYQDAFEYWSAIQHTDLVQKYESYMRKDAGDTESVEDVTSAATVLINEENVKEREVIKNEGTDLVDSKEILQSEDLQREQTIQSADSKVESKDEQADLNGDIIVDEEDDRSLYVPNDPTINDVEFTRSKVELLKDRPLSVKDDHFIDTQDDQNIEEDQINEQKETTVSLTPWKIFDEDWYIRKYTDVTSKMKALELDSVEEYYFSFGCHEGHSPNPFFDEKWYLNTYPDVKLLVEKHQYKSGFDHYCKQGYRDYSPHWLFSESFYKKKYSSLTDEVLFQHGFVNGYDHYLRAGDLEGLSGSLFFDPNFFIGHYSGPISQGVGSYSYYLKHIDAIDPLTQTSWYFNPQWYVQQYSDVKEEVQAKKFVNPLHHYLTNERPFEYAPSMWFDENFYAAEYHDALKHERLSETYRNGYDHFIHEGIELLWMPSPFVDLAAYSLRKEVQQDIKTGLYPNSYVHWLAHHQDADHIDEVISQEKQEYVIVDDIPEDTYHCQGAIWAQFDEDWYVRRYPDTNEKMEICGLEDVQQYYEQVGAFLGHSPNAYFDETWYVQFYTDVQKAIKRGAFKTGFEHYCKVGYKKHRPHWLFSEQYYLQQNPNFAYEIKSSDTFINAYDHYLKKGDALRRSGSLYFDPLVYERVCYGQGKVEKTFFPYRNYLLNITDADRDAEISLYFDPAWYIAEYPEVMGLIKQGDVVCALHHYLTNDSPTLFNPSPWFSERFYVKANPDLAEAISDSIDATFRNGYQHFLLHGCFECRQPHADIDLKTYFLSGHVREDIENRLYRDAFAHWVFNKRLEQWLEKQPEDSHYRLSDKTIQSREYFRKKARYMLPTVAHQKLDFSYEGKPEISVIMLLRNQLPVSLTALASLRANYAGKIQLLIGDNHSSDDTRYIQNSLIGAQILRFAYNIGYGKACNYLLEHVQAPITIFLNNDIYLYPKAIETLCQYLLSAADIGAVGGKIIHPDGNLQEAGSIIWRDGTTTGYMRGDDPLRPEANFVRSVDYCSTAMMAVKTILLQQLKGFSPVYYPAYFEDTDLCVRILKAGYRVIYHPDAVVEHMEYASSDPIVSSGLIRRNHQKFVKEHSDFLRFQHPRHSDNIIIARERVDREKRILFIEDRVPLKRLGSGYVRSNDIVHQMAKLGYKVTVYPINSYYAHLYQIYSDLPETVEVLFDRTIDDIRAFFLERAGYYDIVWIGRTHNLHRILPMMGEANRYLPQDCLVLDTEVIAAPRTQLRANILGLEMNETLEDALTVELSCARHCQTIITVNKIDQEYAKQAGFDNVNILGHMMSVRATPKNWGERNGLLFVGALHDDLSPNFDSLQWFMSAVLPILVEKMEEAFFITIAGYVHPSVDMSVFAKYPQVKLLGPVEDLTHLYNDHRVYIAPTRFAGGIPYKLHEAASFGIPIVAAELLVNQLGWKDDQDILAGSIDNPEFFASQIIRLYQEQKLWDKIRSHALSRIEKECNEHQFRTNLQNILTNVTSHK
ncbi:glycosyltransferase [Commensalibacter oyaizuii]|uniref:Glycosyltransferase n=1 Tax=Commensalibacter oyaizuii TaxID=3043873 RepID=A0ABT6PYB2_9PROT|nr:glycosyltransferase [Commensalibacter sp. TBRC 16381]MDI2089814.1 glycosyltransferase [Commensalibacter sp. TBRC 16381]